MNSTRRGTSRLLILSCLLLLGGCDESAPISIESPSSQPPHPTPTDFAIDLPQGAFVVWESNRTGSWRLWIREFTDGEPRQLTDGPRRRIHCCPHISPDGSRIVYLDLPPDQKAYPRGGALGSLFSIQPDGSGNRRLLASARNYFENRAVVWQSPERLIFIDEKGTTQLFDLEANRTTQLTTKPVDDYPWLIDSTLRWATSGDATFAPFDAETQRVLARTPFDGCQSYFTSDGEIGFWVAAPGGPIRWHRLDGTATGTLLRKSDPLLPPDRGYLYFPMVSNDRRLLVFGASNDEHSHMDSDYEIFLAELSPDELRVTKPPVRITHHPATDRFPDIFQPPLALGLHTGEAPLRVRIELSPGSGSHLWSYGDGSRSEGVSGDHLFDQPGGYQITATQAGSVLYGRAEVRPAAPPQPQSTRLIDNGKRIVVLFDEPISIESFTARLASGTRLIRPNLDQGNRRLILDLETPLQQSDRLELLDVDDRTHPPNRLRRVELEIDPPLWPADRTGLTLLWQTGDSPNLVYEPEMNAETAVLVIPKGRARLDADFSLLPSGGFFTVDDATAHRVLSDCQRTNEFSLESMITPSESSQKRQVLLTMAGRGWSNFTLFQQRQELVFEIRNGGKGAAGLARTAVAKLSSERRPIHLVVTFSSGEFSAYVDGVRTLFTDSIRGGFFHWRARPIVLGSDWNGSNPWKGALEGVAIYNRVLEPAEVEENALRYRALLDSRPSLQEWTVDGTLQECSERPTLEEIAPYREALMTCIYRVEITTGPFQTASRIRVAHWTILDAELVGERQPGETYKLRVSRYRDNPQLESVVLSDTLDTQVEFPLLYTSRP